MDHQEYMSCVEADAPSVLLKGTVKFVEDAILWEMSQIEQCWDAVRNHNDSWLEQKQYEEWAEEMEAQEARRQWEASH
jgi:nitroimidazol reductase NimA-like FMN-containing flavoprotein (pyridoxamine 5'-phosphate oxidase superfamily)